LFVLVEMPAGDPEEASRDDGEGPKPLRNPDLPGELVVLEPVLQVRQNFHSKALEHAVTDRDDRGDAQLGGVEVMKIRATALS
jgi:hypothetical protein